MSKVCLSEWGRNWWPDLRLGGLALQWMLWMYSHTWNNSLWEKSRNQLSDSTHQVTEKISTQKWVEKTEKLTYTPFSAQHHIIRREPPTSNFFLKSEGFQGCPTFRHLLGHTRRRRVVGPHIKYIVTCNHKKTPQVLSKFMILCWAAFTATHGPQVGHRWF